MWGTGTLGAPTASWCLARGQTVWGGMVPMTRAMTNWGHAKSCEAVCELMCTPRGEGSDDGQEADDRWLAYRGYGRRGGYGGY